jgi:hypothetical protein
MGIGEVPKSRSAMRNLSSAMHHLYAIVSLKLQGIQMEANPSTVFLDNNDQPAQLHTHDHDSQPGSTVWQPQSHGESNGGVFQYTQL